MIFEQPRGRGTIALLLSDATEGDDEAGTEVVHWFFRQFTCVYDPQSKHSDEALPVMTQLSEQTALVEIDGILDLGWAVATQTWAFRAVSGENSLRALIPSSPRTCAAFT